VAQRLGVKESTIVQWEEGKAFPEEDKLPSLGEVYEIGLDKLTEAYENSRQARKVNAKTKRVIRGSGGKL